MMSITSRYGVRYFFAHQKNSTLQPMQSLLFYLISTLLMRICLLQSKSHNVLILYYEQTISLNKQYYSENTKNKHKKLKIIKTPFNFCGKMFIILNIHFISIGAI